MLLLVVAVAPVSAVGAGQVGLVSHTPTSSVATGIGTTAGAVVSANGRFVVFASLRHDLVAGQSDSNSGYDLFLFERASGAVTLITHTPASSTTTADGSSFFPSISADGGFVAFSSEATNLVAGQTDPNASGDAFVFERATGTVTLASHAANSASTTANAGSSFPAVTADGAFVVFESQATNLVTSQSDSNGNTDVFMFSRANGAVTLVSRTAASATTTPNRRSQAPAPNADGGFVAFRSEATDLVAGQNDPHGNSFDVFLFARATGAVTLVSHIPGSASTVPDGESMAPSISADGGFVAFDSLGTNLVSSQIDESGTSDAFLFNRATSAVTLVSHTAASATTAAKASTDSTLSADGSTVVFRSTATNLVSGQSDALNTADVFLFARASGAVSLVSHASSGATTAGGGHSEDPAVSADGSFVAFESTATNLVAGQSSGGSTRNVFLYARSTGALDLVSHARNSATTTANASSENPSISATGGLLAFDSNASNLVAGFADSNSATDVYWFQQGVHVGPLADLDGSGNTELAVFRPSNGFWFVRNGETVQWGANGDSPVAADYDGNGKSDIAVFRPSNGYWFVRNGTTAQFGTTGDIAVPGDYDGNGTADIAVFRPSNGYWFVRNGITAQFGASGDVPVPGDYDGNGTTDIAVFRPSNGYWFVRNGITAQFGTAGDIPVPGDYDGNGTSEIGVFRPASGTWFVRDGVTAAFGANGDMPVPGDYDGNEATNIAVFRPSTGTWIVRSLFIDAFGTNGDIPVVLPEAVRRIFFT